MVVVLRRLLCAGLALIASGGPSLAAPPQRVVSINLCTDQLAMLFAGPKQLISVSYLAQEPQSSVMSEQAMAYAVNHGQAEEIYLLAPDLVLAGQYTDPATLSMMARLGLRVEVFAPANALADVGQAITQMGDLFEKSAEAKAIVQRFEAGMQALPPRPTVPVTAASFGPNGYASGARSLAGEIIEAAGLHHLAEDLGLPYGGFLPLEALVMANPDMLITEATKPAGATRSHATSARAHEVLTHPVMAALSGGHVALEDKDWICGLPSVLDAVARLAQARSAASLAQTGAAP